ncbi:hypothetical protein PsorP6_011568 [Peronosclerospora sorghi]|uniref:Uncharacterized protein n=1 Tax=Peronosclerospora sorghi TaxID=230839 RepID=A0ACC0WKN2_9STRA|nr:hypothetical protein PsorP6_011568 [Peronosclerospora sorghi]
MELSAKSHVTLHNESATLVLKVRGVEKEGGRAASPLRKTVVLCRRGRGQFELADYVQSREDLDAFYRVEPHRLEGIDVYSTMLWHLKKDVELSYVRINQPLDSQHEASRRQTRVTGGCLLEMKQSLCSAHVVKYVTFSAEANVLVVTDVGLEEPRGNLNHWLGWYEGLEKRAGELHLLYARLSFSAAGGEPILSSLTTCKHEKFSTIYIELRHIEWKVSTFIRRRCDILRKTWNFLTSASTCR